MKLKASIIFLFVFVVTNNISAQLQTFHLITPTDSISTTLILSSKSNETFVPFQGNEFYSELRQYSLGFFCKAEEKRWKETKVQFKMRLGTLDQANRLERRNY